MRHFTFRGPDGRTSNPQEWLRTWSGRYDKDDDTEYKLLILKHKTLSAADFDLMGQWKDGAWTRRGNQWIPNGRWKPDVASVAYAIWKQASAELPRCPPEDKVTDFLVGWSARKCMINNCKDGKVREPRFGLSRATTLLHFISGGHFPIFDSRVRRAIKRLTNASVQDSVRFYENVFRPLFDTLLADCASKDTRTMDKALFCYGDKKLEFDNPGRVEKCALRERTST